MNKTGIILLLMVAFLKSNVFALQACIQKMDNCRGSELDCSRSVPCYHGNCTVVGSCSCQQCWTGRNCDQYVDNYMPKFLVKTKTVSLTPQDTGILYTVNGLDEDGINICRGQLPCLCSEMRYSIARGNYDNLFQVDATDGDVYLRAGRVLRPGSEYNLVIVVGSAHGEVYAETDDSGDNEFQLNFIVGDAGFNDDDQHEVSALQENTDDENYSDDQHIRIRRAAGTPQTTNDTTIQMSYTDTFTSMLNVGDRVDLNLTILVPAGVTMDFTMEIFTSDPENQTAAYALCGLKVKNMPSGVTTTVPTVTPIVSPNALLPSINDHAVISFGNVTGKPNTADADRTIIITFSAILVPNSPYVVDGQNYSIVAGTSYASDTYIWVAAATFTANLPADDRYYPSSQAIDGPSSIGSNGYGIYTVNLYATNPFGTMKADVFGNQEPDDSYSSGGIVISQFGSNYMCTRGVSDVYSFTFVGKPSTSGLTTSHSSLLADGVINCDAPGSTRSNPNTTANMMTIRFLIFIPPNGKPVNSILSMGATFTINDKTIWTNVLNITIDAQDDTKEAPAPTMTVRNASVTTPLQGVATIMVDISIPELKYSNLVLQVSTASGAAELMSLCSAIATWGINIPTVAAAVPNMTSSTGGSVPDQMTANFGRVWNSALIPGNITAGTVTVTVGVRVEDAGANGKSVTVQLLNSAGTAVAGTTKTVTINVDSSTADVVNSSGIVNVDMNDMLNATGLVTEGDAMIEMTVSFSNATSFGSLAFEAMSSLLNESMEGRLCRASVSFVGKNIPCINMQSINSKVAYSKVNSAFQDAVTSLAAMNLGSVCLTGPTDPTTTDGKIVLNAAFELPKQIAGISGTSFTMYGGVKLGTSMIWAGSTTYSILTSQTEKFPACCLPTISASVSPSTPATPGAVVMVLIQIKIPPASQSVYKLTVTSPAAAPFVICQLNIQYLGYNFPCVDPNPQPGNTSRVATTRLNYDSFDVALGAYRTAILDFGAMSNLGQDPFTSNPTPDKNTIVVAAMLKIDSAATQSLTLQYTFKYSSNTNNSQLVIPLSTSAQPIPPPATTTNATLSSLDGTNTIGLHVTKVVALDFQMPAGPSAASKVVFSNPNSANNDYVFCSGAVTKVGQNIPCLNATRATVATDNSAGASCSNSLTVTLGNPCLTTIVNDPTQNWVRVEVAVNILNLKLTGSIKILATLTIGTTLNVQAGPLTLTVDASSPTTTSSNANLTAISLMNGTVLASVGSRTWVDFNLTVPSNVTLPLQLMALGGSDGARAIMTVTGVRVSAAGINVACIKNTTIVDVVFNSSSTVTTSQHDKATVDFGYITNNGLTYRRGYYQPYDDQITISVQVLMTDHPKTDNGATFPLTVIFMSDGDFFNATQLLTVSRNMTESADITVQAQVTNPKLFKPMEVANVNFLLSHSPMSTAEPTEILIRLYLPNYINFTGSLTANVSISVVAGAKPTSFLISAPFYFDEIIEANFSLTIDPTGVREPGSGMINATSIGQVFAKITQRTIGGTPYPSTNNYMYSGKGFYWIYAISGGDCHNPLGMQSGTINDCQISASATASADFGPSKARYGNANGKLWKPAIRNGLYQNYIQVDFGNQTRVSQILLQQDSCCRAPSSIMLQYSDQGTSWTDGHTDSALNYTGDTATVDLATPFEGRMLRIIINGTTQPTDATTTYVGVKLEFHGCSITTDALLSDICNASDKTIYSTDVNQYRHFSVDSQQNAVYACDIQPNSLSLRCFCSIDGTTWKNIPSYITNIVGFNGATGLTYARDNQNITFFKSSDCFSWMPANSSEVNDAKANSQFKYSMVVPGFAQNEAGMTLTNGKWTASFDGLYLNNNKRLGWS